MPKMTNKEALNYFCNLKENAIKKKDVFLRDGMSLDNYNNMLIKLHNVIKDYEEKIAKEDEELDQFIRELNAEQDEIDAKLEMRDAEAEEQNENLNY